MVGRFCALRIVFGLWLSCDMTMKYYLVIAGVLFALITSYAQKPPTKKELVEHYGFQEHSIQVSDENIVFYTYQKGNIVKTKLVLYLQGSDPSPQFSYRVQNGKIQKLCWLNGEFSTLSDEYIYAVVEKVGFEGLIDEDQIPKPAIYQKKNSLGNRVFRANAVIDHLDEKHTFEKVIVYGHSEGAPVGARLATVNDKITHLGFWAGNALPDFYDFILENRIEYFKGNISDSTAQSRIDQNIEQFRQIANDSINTQGTGYTNQRWWSYSEPPINNLLKIDIPIFVQVASQDQSAPIESTYLIPLEFARIGKTNLTYKVCLGCDHGFVQKNQDGADVGKWKEIFADFILWSEKNQFKTD